MLESKFAMPDAEVILRKEWDARGKPYYEEPREYYSTGCVTFDVVGAPTIVTGQMPRYIIRASKGQTAQLFAYAIGDLMGVANCFTTAGAQQLTATKGMTNLLEARKTNTEDFAAMGAGFQAFGLRIEMTPTAPGTVFDNSVPAAFGLVLQNGIAYVEDPGSHIVSPEVRSPLMLQDTLGRMLQKNLSLKEVWNNRASDDIALGRGLGPLGAESYLMTQGEPTTYNCKRLGQGIVWRQEGQITDTRFNVEAVLENDIWAVVSWPQALVAPDEEEPINWAALTKIHLDYQVILAGKAFYAPSQNAG